MVLTIERTAKRYKVLHGIGLVTFCFGLAVGLYSSVSWGLAIIVIGLFFTGLAKLLGWWNHA